MTEALLSPESSLLLVAARPHASHDVVLAAARAVRSWPMLVLLAERERACGTLWRLLSPHGASLDADGMAALRRVALVEGFRGQRQRVKLAGAVRTLASGGLPVMLLKGAALATTVYGAFEERAMSDLDVLVRAAEGRRALELLVSAGWRHDDAQFPLDMYVGHQHLPPLTDGQLGSVMLEPHTALFPEGSPFALEAAELWRDARSVAVDGIETLVPSEVHLALHACIHLTWSHFLASGGWRTLRDLQTLSVRGGLSWDALVASARAAGAATCCYWPLALGRTAGVLDVPEPVLRSLQPRLPASVLGLLTRHFLLQLFSPEVSCPSARLRRSLWTMAVQPSTRGAGAARPWSGNERFARFGWAGPAQTRAQRVAAWSSYLRAAVAGRAMP